MSKSAKFLAALLIVISAAHVSFAYDSTTTTAATAEPEFKVWSAKQGLFRMIYTNADVKKAQIKFVDNQDNVLYSGKVKFEGGFMKPFDLSRLPVGTYKFVLETEEDVLTETVKVLEGTKTFALQQ